jgi:threonylcarbamoyladenosine tRNA methylthiotransferase MtaB
VRRYRAADFRALVERVRAVMPEVALTADVMVGFPGETEAEHAESLDLIRAMAFSEQHVFRYSCRPGTAAARLPDDVPPPVKRRRSEEARALDAELRRAYKGRFLGRTMDVLWEEPASGPVSEDGDPVWSGLTDNYLRVFARGALHEGQVTAVHLEEFAVDGIYGQIAQGELAWMTASSARSSAAPSRPTSSTETSR